MCHLWRISIQPYVDQRIAVERSPRWSTSLVEYLKSCGDDITAALDTEKANEISRLLDKQDAEKSKKMSYLYIQHGAFVTISY